MARRLKLRISRVIPSFQSCRSKDPTSLPENPAPAISSTKFRLSPVNPKPFDIDFPTNLPESKRFSVKQPAKIVSVGCGCRNSSRSRREKHAETDFISDLDFRPREFPASDFCWKKEEKWHVVAKVQEEMVRQKISDDGEICPPASPASSPAKFCFQVQDRRLKNQKIKIKKKNLKNQVKCRVSTSSADTGWFSSEEEDGDETETLVSSRSFSSDSSEFYSNLCTIQESPGNRRFQRKGKRYGRQKRTAKKPSSSPEKRNSGESGADSPARRSVFRRLIPCTVNGKVRESFAVVKKSEDPYGDFRNSMLEMILEKQMFEAKDLEQLLQCFLSLNSQHHHRVIVKVFSEIWEVLFCKPFLGGSEQGS